MDLSTLLATARHHLALFLGCLAIGATGGGLYAFAQTPTYTASSTVLFSLERGTSVSELAEGTTFTQQLVPSYALIVTMPVVLDPVIDRLDLKTSATRLAQQIEVQFDQGSLIMEIAVVDTSPQRVTDIAEAIAEQLIQTVPVLSVRSGGQAQVNVTTMSRGVNNVTVARLPLPAGLGLGALVGLVVATGLVGLFEFVGSTPLVRDRRTASRVASAPVLTVIPPDAEARRRPVPVSTHPYLPQSEGYRLLLTNLQLMRSPGAPLVLVVCATARGDGSTSTAVNLAVAFCHTGQRVLLVDADLRDPNVATVLGIRDEDGLSTALVGAQSWRDLVQTWQTQIWGDRRLSVLAAGGVPDNASDLVGSPKMHQIVAEARRDFDVVVIDGPDLQTAADAAAVAAHTDGAVLVVDARSTRLRQLGEAVNRLRMAGGTVLGLALNRAPEEGAPLATVRAVAVGKRPRRILHASLSAQANDRASMVTPTGDVPVQHLGIPDAVPPQETTPDTPDTPEEKPGAADIPDDPDGPEPSEPVRAAPDDALPGSGLPGSGLPVDR
jgi:capsular exopolysaccharide synthesis family protein